MSNNKLTRSIWYNIQFDSNITGFLIFLTVFWAGQQHCSMFGFASDKNTYFHQIFTQCIYNQYTYFDVLTYQMWQQVMERNLILLCFFKEFSYIIDEHSSLNGCFSNKLSMIVFLINIHILIHRHARCDCKLLNGTWFYCVF